MWTAFGLFAVFLVIVIIRYALESPDANKNKKPTISVEEGNLRKDELIRQFFTPKVEVVPNDSLDEDGIRTLRKIELSKTEASYIVDDFTKDELISVTKISNLDLNFVPLFTTVGNSEIVMIAMSFIYLSGAYRIKLGSNNSLFSLGMAQTIFFLFEDKDVISYTFPVTSVPDGAGGYIANVPLTEQQLRVFADKKLDRWRVDNPANDMTCVGDLTKNVYFYDRNEVQYIIKQTAIEVMKAKNKFIR